VHTPGLFLSRIRPENSSMSRSRGAFSFAAFPMLTRMLKDAAGHESKPFRAGFVSHHPAYGPH
jgi:hypothetical protein